MEPQKDPNPNYLPYPPQPKSIEEEVDLRALFKALWKGKWIITITTLVFAIGSVVYALSLPNIYKADALLAPTESSNAGGLSQMAGQLGGLAALAGVNLGGGESSQIDLAIQVMKSRQFIEAFIDKHDLLVPLMAAEGWNMANNSLMLNKDIYDQQKKEWLRKPQGLLGSQPSAQEAYRKFTNDVFKVVKDEDSGLYRLSVNHYSPYIAKDWVNWLIEDINLIMKERTVRDASKNLSYLKEQLDRTSVADMQRTFYKIIEEQTKSLMLAEVQDEFIFTVVDPAVIPEIKAGPSRALICIVLSLTGLFLSVFIILSFNVFSVKNKEWRRVGE